MFLKCEENEVSFFHTMSVKLVHDQISTLYLNNSKYLTLLFLDFLWGNIVLLLLL